MGASGSQLRNVGLIGVLLMLCILLWGAYVIVPAGSRGVVLWLGRVEERIMNEGLNFQVPLTESVMKVEGRGQPHPFREIEASAKEYQSVKMTGMRTFHIDPAFGNDLYQTVGLDFADKVIEPACKDFVKEVVPMYPIGESLPTREEIRQTAMKQLGENVAKYHIMVDDIYFANIRFSPEYAQAIEAKQVAQQQGETHKQILAQREIEAQQKVATAQGDAESSLVVAQEPAKASEVLARALTPILVSYKRIARWHGVLPQGAGGASPFIALGKMSAVLETASPDKK